MIGGSRTLLVAVRGLALRADLVGRSRPRVRAVHALPVGEVQGDLDARIERLARLGGPLRGRVWVLTDEVLARTLELEARAARGLSAEHLDRALAFEAQVYSGIASADGVTAWRALDERGARRRFLVAQVHAGDLAAVKSAIEEGGGRFAGLLHPGGAPCRLAADGDPAGAFARVETWSDVRVRVERAADGALSQEFGAELDQERGAPETETLAVERDAAELALEDELVLARWLEAWGEVLAAREPPVPVLVAPRAPVSAARLAWSAAVLSLLVAAAAWTDRTTLKQKLSAERGEVASLQASIDVFSANRNAMTALRRELEQLAAEEPPAAASGVRWSAELPARVLAVLAEQRPAGVRFERLDIDWRDSRLSGVAVGGASLDALATDLTRALASSGYEASLAKRSQRDDGLFDFELVVSQAGRAVHSRSGDEG